ncbi:MAG: hypothetical protein JW846_08485 [Dehalococcoidia bacterium]|nr:hypothetical protein [Dehalococcoidia bacterium]
MTEPAVIHSIDRVSPDVVEQFKSLSSVTVHEACGGRGALSCRIKPIDPHMKVCGTAVTPVRRPYQPDAAQGHLSTPPPAPKPMPSCST